MAEFASVARIVKRRGIKGEVAAELLTDFPERFSSLTKVRIYKGGKEHWEEIEDHWFHRGRIILKFLGRDRPEVVEELIGGEVQIPEEERVELPEGSYYQSDLVGCRILEGSRLLGDVTEILETGPTGFNLVVKTPEGSEFMVPLAREFVLGVDVEEKVIRVKLPAGLNPQR